MHVTLFMNQHFSFYTNRDKIERDEEERCERQNDPFIHYMLTKGIKGEGNTSSQYFNFFFFNQSEKNVG